MKTIAEWFANDGGMPPEIAKLARENMTEPKSKAKTLGDAIILGMRRWDKTPQGFDFWNDCHYAALNSGKWPTIPASPPPVWHRYGDQKPTEEDTDSTQSVCGWVPRVNGFVVMRWDSAAWATDDLWTAAPRKEGGV